MKHFGTIVPILLLVFSMKLIEHKAATSPSYKNSAISQALLIVSPAIDQSLESSFQAPKPYLFSAIPISYQNEIQDNEQNSGLTEIDALVCEEALEEDDELVCDSETIQENQPVEICEVTSMDIDNLDLMLDKLKKLYVLKKLILNKPHIEIQHSYEVDQHYQEMSLASSNEINYAIDVTSDNSETITICSSTQDMPQ